MAHKILILGPQGSGKGTQAERLAKKLGIPALSMGQLLRDEIAFGTELGKKVEGTMNAGLLVSDVDALAVLAERLKKPDAVNGYILDGYPRNAAQYDAFETFDTPTAVLVIDVPREESLMRLTKRAQAENRADDTAEVISKRLAIYENDTKPIIDRFAQKGLLRTINGLGTMDEVESAIQEALGE